MTATGGHRVARGRSRRAAMRFAVGRHARPASGGVAAAFARLVQPAAAR